MSESFQSFIANLGHAISNGLPGIKAQFLMAPPGRGKSYPDLEKTGGYLTGAVCILLYEKEGSLHIPIIERTNYDGVHSGQLALPGGKLDINDKNIETCALRETHEEIGVLVSDERIIGQLTKLYIPPSNFMVHPLVAWHPQQPHFLRNEREINKIHEMPLKSLFDEKSYCLKTVTTRPGIQFESPGIKLNNEIIWGATAMMLSELKVLIETFTEPGKNL